MQGDEVHAVDAGIDVDGQVGVEPGALGRTFGELIDMIECLAKRAKAVSLRSPDLLGRSPSRVAADFRSGLKDRLMVNVASGWGRQLLAAGTPCAWGAG